MPVLIFAIALAMSIAIVGAMSPIDITDSGVSEQLDQYGDDTNVTSEVEPETESGFLSFAIGAVGTVGDFMGLVLALPATLNNLGAPAAVANVLGRGLQIVVVLGMLQVLLQYRVK